MRPTDVVDVGPEPPSVVGVDLLPWMGATGGDTTGSTTGPPCTGVAPAVPHHLVTSVMANATAADTLTPTTEPGGVIMKEEPVTQDCPVEILPSEACTDAVASCPTFKTTAATTES